MISLTYHSTLYYYDEPLVYLCKDKYTSYYLCVAVDEEDIETIFGLTEGVGVACKIPSNALLPILEQHLSIRQAFDSNREDSFCVRLIGENYYAEPVSASIEDFLPSNNFVLDTDIKTEAFSISDHLQALAIQENAPGLRLKIAKEGVVGLAMGEAATVMNLYDKVFTTSSKKLLSNGYSLEANHAMAASFDLYALVRQDELTAQLSLSLLSEPVSLIEQLSRMLISTAEGSDANESLKVLQGHAFSNLRSLLLYLQEHNLTLSQEIYDPVTRSGYSLALSRSKINRIAKVMANQTSLGTELMELTGVFTLADSTNGTWRFVDGEQKEYKGKADPRFTSGLTVDDITYSTVIRAEIDEDSIGKLSTKYTLDKQPERVGATGGIQ